MSKEDKTFEVNYVFIRIAAVLIMLNIFFIPFICNEYWLVNNNDINEDALSFSEMIENLSEGYYSSNDDVPIDVLYYIGGLICTLIIFVGALKGKWRACTFGSSVGIGLCLYVFYRVYLGNTRWSIGLHDADLSIGYYISCVGFVVILLALSKKQE